MRRESQQLQQSQKHKRPLKRVHLVSPVSQIYQVSAGQVQDPQVDEVEMEMPNRQADEVEIEVPNKQADEVGLEIPN